MKHTLLRKCNTIFIKLSGNYYIFAVIIVIGLLNSDISIAIEQLIDSSQFNSLAKDLVLQQFGKDTQGKLSVTIEKLHNKLKLKHCNQDLEHEIPPYSKLNKHINIRISCPDPLWKIHIPVKLTLNESIIVANRTIPRGQLLMPADLTTQEVDTLQLNEGFFYKTEELMNMVTNYTINAGSIITPRSISRMKDIRHGDLVQIIAGNDNFNIQTQGTAIEHGSMGDTIKVKNNSSKKIIKGVVSASGSVNVNIP